MNAFPANRCLKVEPIPKQRWPKNRAREARGGEEEGKIGKKESGNRWGGGDEEGISANLGGRKRIRVGAGREDFPWPETEVILSCVYYYASLSPID